MRRRIFSTACIAALFYLMAVPTAPAGAAAKNTTGSAQEVPASVAPGTDKPVVMIPTDDFAPTAELAAVHFDFDSSKIRPAEANTLDKNAEWLKANPRTAVLVEGAADQRGTRAYNRALAERRSQAVKSYLVAQGVASDRIMIAKYGEGRLACPTNAARCWSDNRRVDFQLKVMNKQAP